MICRHPRIRATVPPLSAFRLSVPKAQQPQA